MYSSQLVKRSLDRQSKKLYIEIEYLKDGVPVATEQKDFPLNTNLDGVKRYVARQIKEYEEADVNNSTIVPGVLDLSTVAEVPKTQAEIDKENWKSDWYKVYSAQRLLDAGVVLKPAHATALTTLRTSLGDTLKIEYLGLI